MRHEAVVRFLFHTGSIRGVVYEEKVKWFDLFLFHTGSIRGRKRFENHDVDSRWFLFHTGSIRGVALNIAATPYISFYSILVRLEVADASRGTHDFRFYSILVRLEEKPAQEKDSASPGFYSILVRLEEQNYAN